VKKLTVPLLIALQSFFQYLFKQSSKTTKDKTKTTLYCYVICYFSSITAKTIFRRSTSMIIPSKTLLGKID